MKIYIDNTSGYLNDYYFQTLCLLYFPGEKFSPEDEGVNAAWFAVKPAGCDGKTFHASVKLKAGDRYSEAEFDGTGYTPVLPLDGDFYAANALGKAFLEAGMKLFGFGLPWGYLTGLRPVKRAKYYLDRGYSDGEVMDLFTRDYSVSAEKAGLSVETARTEQTMLAGVSERACGLYVSIPFCPTRCDYCSFVSYSNDKLFALIPDYLKKLRRDIKLTGELIKDLGMDLRAIYIGGGTPSILTPSQIDGLLTVIEESVDIKDGTEFTFEGGRPDTLTAEKLRAVKAHGVGRISINPQSTDDKVLENIGRKHTSADFFRACETASAVGFGCINADLIAGLPGDGGECFKKSLEDVISLGFDNITVHTLSIKNAAPIRFIGDGFYDPRGRLARESVEYARKRLAQAGLYPYYLYRQKNTVGNAENTGFSVKGKENLYNVLMMEEYSTVFACGAGAITKLVSADRSLIRRLPFPKYPFEYLGGDDVGVWREAAMEFFASDRKGE
ncbi:MAG: coproporphyrinogen dehydrogenase HemZ [Clostridia bacterium]|nr:coproporphyrinogen dehydrogenase HemZ [Clostridia bacterium]